MVEEDVGRERPTLPEYQPLKPHPLRPAHVQVVIVIVVGDRRTFYDDVARSVATGTNREVAGLQDTETGGEAIDTGRQLEVKVRREPFSVVKVTASAARLVTECCLERLTRRDIWVGRAKVKIIYTQG